MKNSIKCESWKIYHHAGDSCPPNRYRSFKITMGKPPLWTYCTFWWFVVFFWTRHKKNNDKQYNDNWCDCIYCLIFSQGIKISIYYNYKMLIFNKQNCVESYKLSGISWRIFMNMYCSVPLLQLFQLLTMLLYDLKYISISIVTLPHHNGMWYINISIIFMFLSCEYILF